MEVLSHRGFWKTNDEKNTPAAFTRSFTLGFGTETDVRDWDGELVISHDPPTGMPLSFSRFCELYSRDGGGLPLALNIKSDGLASVLRAALETHALHHAFVFDMSVPDTLGYLRAGIPFYTRLSEYEPTPALLESAAGVWVDCFESEWISRENLAALLASGKRVCLVSPELHHRDHLPFWNRLAVWLDIFKQSERDRLMLCTDFPTDARECFR